MKAKKKFGYIMAAPAQFAIHRRRGRTLRAGQGISFFCLPFIDRYYLIPSTAQSVSFAADQITAENQGVEVAGFAVWRIAEPEKAAACFDFAESDAALAAISGNLRNVVESAIRHQVANMTIEDVLRKRGSIILQLKSELSYIAGEWGLLIETVEIRTVKVLSEQLFAHMQAAFRDQMRLESESSALKTEQELAQCRFAQKDEIALREQEFQRRDLERRTEAEKLEATADAELQAFRLNRQRELVGDEKRLHDERATLETARKQHAKTLALIEDETKRQQIETANTEDHALALVKQLPAALGALRVAELNIGYDPLRVLAGALSNTFKKSGVGRGAPPYGKTDEDKRD